MKGTPPRKTFKDYLTGKSGEPPRVGPTVESWKDLIPQDLEGLNPRPSATQADLEGYALDAMVPMGSVAGTMRKVGAAAAKPTMDAVIQAYHASRSQNPFDKFSRDFYGKGSGGNRLGMGVYGTDQMKEGIEYLKSLFRGQPSEVVTQQGNVVPVPIDVATALKAGDGSVDELANKTSKMLDYLRGKPSSRTPSVEKKRFASIENAQGLLTSLDRILSEGVDQVRRPGTLYEVGLDVDKGKLLNFDRELIDQTPFVQNAVKSAINIGSSSNPYDVIKYHELLNRGIRTPEVSRRLEDAGIHGVQASSSMMPQTKNYSIFNPDRVGIKRVMGILGMLTGAGAAGKPNQTKRKDGES